VCVILSPRCFKQQKNHVGNTQHISKKTVILCNSNLRTWLPHMWDIYHWISNILFVLMKTENMRMIRAVSFELCSHYQMMGTNPAQNFGMVLLNSRPLHLQQHYHMQGLGPEKERNSESISLYLYISHHLC